MCSWNRYHKYLFVIVLSKGLLPHIMILARQAVNIKDTPGQARTGENVDVQEVKIREVRGARR